MPLRAALYSSPKHHHPDVPEPRCDSRHILAQHHKFKLEKALRRTPELRCGASDSDAESQSRISGMLPPNGV